MRTQKAEMPSTIGIGNDRTADMLVPRLALEQELVIIPKDIAKHLLELMPQASVQQVVTAFSEKCGNIETEQEWIELLRHELNFHTTMRMLKEYYREVPERELVV